MWWRLAVQVLAQLIGSDVRRLQSRFQQASDLGRRCLGGQRGVADDVDANAANPAEGSVEPGGDVQRRSRMHDQDAVYLPAAQSVMQGMRFLQPGKLIVEGAGEPGLAAVIGNAVIAHD